MLTNLQPVSELPLARLIHTPLPALPIAASPFAVVPTKLPFRMLFREPESIRTPSPALPEIRLPSGGTTKTGGTWPLLPVGLLAFPVALSTNSRPPISLPSDRLVIAMPSRPLPIRDQAGRAGPDPVGDHHVAG